MLFVVRILFAQYLLKLRLILINCFYKNSKKIVFLFVIASIILNNKHIYTICIYNYTYTYLILRLIGNV